MSWIRSCCVGGAAIGTQGSGLIITIALADNGGSSCGPRLINVMNRLRQTDSKLSLDGSWTRTHIVLMEADSRPVALERRQPGRNMARFYLLELDLDLFGTVLARRCWGRIGSTGRSLAVPFPSTTSALEELRRLERLKRRRGYVDRPE